MALSTSIGFWLDGNISVTSHHEGWITIADDHTEITMFIGDSEEERRTKSIESLKALIEVCGVQIDRLEEIGRL